MAKRRSLTPQQKIDALEAIDHGLSLWAWHRRLCNWRPGRFPKRLANGKKQRRQDGYKKPPNPSEETCARPGMPGKVRQMARRYAEGRHLYHPGDLPPDAQEIIGLAQQGNTTETGNGRCTAAVKERAGILILMGKIFQQAQPKNGTATEVLGEADKTYLAKQLAEAIPYEPADSDL